MITNPHSIEWFSNYLFSIGIYDKTKYPVLWKEFKVREMQQIKRLNEWSKEQRKKYHLLRVKKKREQKKTGDESGRNANSGD